MQFSIVTTSNNCTVLVLDVALMIGIENNSMDFRCYVLNIIDEALSDDLEISVVSTGMYFESWYNVTGAAEYYLHGAKAAHIQVQDIAEIVISPC